MNIVIDPHAGFCFGVVYAITKAEEILDEGKKLYCLGDIVHNNTEVERLCKKGLIIVNYDDLPNLHDCTMLIRAHGEPPETYRIALKNNIELIDASCPVVLKLQNRIRIGYDEILSNNGQIVIFGNEGHAEVNGLVGQINNTAIIINTLEDLSKIDFLRPVYFFSQTTKSTSDFQLLSNEIKKRLEEKQGANYIFNANDTICRQVSNRIPQLLDFATTHDLIIFVSDRKSSNGISLYKTCLKVNVSTYFISDESELQSDWLKKAKSIGITGATSTPRWLMEKIAQEIQKII